MKISQKNIWIIFSIFFMIVIAAFFGQQDKSEDRQVPESKPAELIEPPEAQVEVAVVIDDWGYNLHNLDLLKDIELPFTVSILPNLRYSTEIAEAALNENKEVILHLPLQPEMMQREIGLEKNTITTTMTEAEILANLGQALSSVAGATGVSNHMGSAATADSRVMSVIFRDFEKRDVFFLDNLVTENSVGRKLAEQMGIKFVSRDVFLDNRDDYEYIQGQFKQLIKIAQAQGQAVGVGHARRNTLLVLQELAPLFEQQGIKLVFLSDLAK
ncbi:divergent polysaccharide deacetylase family protein [Candidatus Omnitrophota bacterium]